MLFKQNNKIILFIDTNKTVKINAVKKRNMHRLRQLLYHGVNNPEGTRSFSTITHWSQKVRVKKPLTFEEVKPKDKFYDRATGYEIMQPRDPSGFNHMLLADETFQSDVYFLIKGSFTSSAKEIDGIVPEKFSDYQFNGKAKAQYYMEYQKPKLILKTDVKRAYFDVFTLVGGEENKQTPDQKKFIKKLVPIEKDMY